jgi:hypothetical protein
LMSLMTSPPPWERRASAKTAALSCMVESYPERYFSFA